ncbi:MAG: hypothetical protein NZ903_02180 [Candidatus Micrarchaeota archaeon]|nr:hypothetical protein [Candidatus Micrarchaeota archaeon]
MGKFLDDVEKGIDPIDAGWTEEPCIEFHPFIEKGVCEVRNAKVRIAFRLLDKEIYKHLDKDGRWLVEAHNEIVNAKNVLNEIVQTINDTVFQPAIVLLGWKRMLSTSGFPVLIDRVLKAGFTIDKWVVTATRSSDVLSLKVVQRWWDENEVINGLNKFSAKRDLNLEAKFARKVMEILKWDQVTASLNKNLATALGILWFADSKFANLMFPESTVYVQKEIWNVVEKIVGEKSETIRNDLIETIKDLEAVTGEKDKLGRLCPIAQWSFIIRLPW